MATPLLRALRQAYPNAYLTWMVEHVNQEAVNANPFIDEIISWDGGYWPDLLPRRWKKWLNPRRGLGLRWLASALKLRHQLRQRHYDVLISFHPEQWPLLLRTISPAVSIGIFETKPGFGKIRRDYRHLYTRTFSAEDLPLHRTDKYLTPLQVLNVAPLSGKQMTLGFTEQDQQAVFAFLRQQGIAHGERLIVIAPATTWASKVWPASRFAALGDALARRLGYRIILIGAAKERAVLEDVSSQMQCPAIHSAGRLSFRQIAALLAEAALVISGDTGPMHAAAAVGTPYVALFGATTPGRYAPLEGNGMALSHPVPCGPCECVTCSQEGDNRMRCMRLITVEEVLEAATQILRKKEVTA